MPMYITQHDLFCTEEQEGQTLQIDQHNLVHTGRPKSQVMGNISKNNKANTDIHKTKHKVKLFYK